MQNILAKLKALPYYDKILHFTGGALLAPVFLVLLMLAVKVFPAWAMMAPYVVAYYITAVMVHGSKEANDYLDKKNGLPHTPSIFDFAAGMAGSIAGLYILGLV